MEEQLSIIIVNWNTRELLRDCLASLFSKPSKVGFEAFVVDNASSDGSIEMTVTEFPQVNVIQNEENLGYARANNLGIRASKTENILLLNSDTVVDTDILPEMINLLRSDPKAGVIGCKLIGTDEETQESYGFAYPFGPTVGHPDKADNNGLIECAIVWGAFFLIKREVIDQVGMLDEDFFMFYEDVEWCWRIHDAGWKIMYDPNHTIQHVCRASCGQVESLENERHLYFSEKIMFRKWLPHPIYKKWWRKRYFYHLRCIVLYWIASRLTGSVEIRKRLKSHLAGYKILTGCN